MSRLILAAIFVAALFVFGCQTTPMARHDHAHDQGSEKILIVECHDIVDGFSCHNIVDTQWINVVGNRTHRPGFFPGRFSVSAL